ncbi:hypothetical protein MUK42_07100 [Musa troglodytarum]|uniref:Glycosyltransferase 61 catalytic domain-containing protein n=1 Tax=Musa troglodytarum TaxID=320322 RepID=A0A9E7HDB0_9LILI|nr:hypothetical protein MUK42_07100 [Musa troglodytarum]
MPPVSPKASSTQRTSSFPAHSTNRSVCFLATTFITLVLLLFLLQIETLKSSLSSSSFSWPFFQLHKDESPCHDAAAELNRTRSILRDLVTFLPLKDVRVSENPRSGRGWFMSSMNDTLEDDDDDAQHLYFPSQASNGRLLCLSARDVSDGTKNSYALAWREALPRDAALLPGLTFISDTYYDHGNMWHGISAITPFVSWHQRKQCAAPDRWVLFHRGELRTRMGGWVQAVAEAAIGEVRIEDFKEHGDGPSCFEQAVVFRHEWAMKKTRKRQVYDMIRCKARSRCGVAAEAAGSKAAVRMTLLLRPGSRSFKNESAVIRIFERECEKVDGCTVKVAWSNNMTFCDQVKLMSETDVVASPHGAQLANLLLMDRNSSIMEFYPRGWRERAGAGQYVFRWMADGARMQHKGSWWDPQGEECQSTDKTPPCIPFYKNRQIGHDEVYFAGWAAKVLADAKEHKLKEASYGGRSPEVGSAPCPCKNTHKYQESLIHVYGSMQIPEAPRANINKIHSMVSNIS